MILLALTALIPTADACSIATEHIDHVLPDASTFDAPVDAVIRLGINGVILDPTDDYGVTVLVDGEPVSGSVDKQWPLAWGGGGFVTFRPDAPLPEGADVTVEYRDPWYYDDPETMSSSSFRVGDGVTEAPEVPGLEVFDLSEKHTRNPSDGMCEVEWSRHIELAVDAPKDPLGVVTIWSTDEDGEPLDEQPYFVLELSSYDDYDDLGFGWHASADDPDKLCLAAAYENAAGVSSKLSEPSCHRVRRQVFGCSTAGITSTPGGALPGVLALLAMAGLVRRRSDRA